MTPRACWPTTQFRDAPCTAIATKHAAAAESVALAKHKFLPCVCRPKDPPTLQRFADSLAQMSLGKSSALSTVQRHEAGIRARQQAQVTAAAREVAALDAGAQPDAD
jgi:hypothetical protein